MTTMLPRPTLQEQLEGALTIQALVNVLIQADPHPDSLSEADRTVIRQWAQRAYVASRRLGGYAQTEARAREAGTAHVKMRHLEDAQRADRPDIAPDHFAAGLGAYFAVLDLTPVDPHAINGWLKVSALDSHGVTLADYVYCPDCAVAQSARERALGHALPADHEEYAETGHVRIRRLRGETADLRCCRCEPPAFDLDQELAHV